VRNVISMSASRFMLLAVLALPLDGAEPDANNYLRYAHPTVREPFVDGVNLAVPAELEDKRSAALGLVDVTKKPFNADATGVRDATKALQEAINFARDHQMICYFPPGTYRISDTLECVRQLYQRANGRVFGAHLWPCVLAGSRAGKERPRILLAPHSPGFDNPQKPKYVVHFWARGYQNPTTADRVTDGRNPEQDQPNISMNQMFVNLDIVIGEGNPGAVALRHQAAEGSAIEDCTIDATHGLTGIEGGIGSGGSSAGVTVIGGRVGLDFRTSQPTPVITGFTLIGQSEAAILYSGRQTLVAAGLKVVSRGNAGPLIVASGGEGKLFLQGADQPMQGQISLVDSEIVFENATAASGKERVAIQSTRSLYLNNVFVRGATKVALTTRGSIAGNPDGWIRVLECAEGGAPVNKGELHYNYPIYIDGRRQENNVAKVMTNQTPPADLQSRHLWSGDFPSGESQAAVNVKSPPFNARGDGKADDTAAIQKAINESEVVFLPKGYYRISRTITLRPRTKLVGVGQHLSVLVVTGAEGDFADEAKPAPMILTADAPEAETVLAFCGLWAPHNIPGAFALNWRCGGKSVFRAVELYHSQIYGQQAAPSARRSAPPPRRHPLVLVTGHGGGNWYNFREGGEYPQAPGYRHLLIEEASGPINFYQLSPQHVSSDFAVELRKAQYVSIFGTKYEGSSPMTRVADSAHVRLFGHGGNGKPVAGSVLFKFERSRDFLVANAVEGPTKIGERSLSHRLGGTDLRLWSMISDESAPGVEMRTQPLERPVLYRRGNPYNLLTNLK